jgi:hypothetical protein
MPCRHAPLEKRKDANPVLKNGRKRGDTEIVQSKKELPALVIYGFQRVFYLKPVAAKRGQLFF